MTEADPAVSLSRRATAEGVGTALLAAVVVGSGIFAQRLSPGDVGLQLLESSIATAGGLVALILAFGPVSGAHLNPVITLAHRLLGGTTTRDLLAYVPAQVAGGCAGTVVANLMFELDAVELSSHVRSSGGLWLGEIVATFGLLTVVLGVGRSSQRSAAPYAVAGYIAAAYWFTSSTSFANPAVTVGRSLSDTFAGIAPRSVPAFVVAQLAGALVAVALALFLHPDRRSLPMPLPTVAGQSEAVQPTPPTVLFLCVHNAGRSQMALGWFTHLAAGRAVAWSGGSEPANQVNPAAVAAMAEVGIDIAQELPKPWTDEIVRTADVVITMGCGDTCPFVPGKRYEDWELADPAGQDVGAVRSIRDEIEGRVRILLRSLGITVG